MPIIAISISFYLQGKGIAEAVAKKLGYTCISQEMLFDTFQEFNMPDKNRIWYLPFILNQATFWEIRYITNIRTAIIRHLKKDNVVFHGFCGQFFLNEIDHVLNVKITEDIEDRIKLIMNHYVVPRKEALSLIKTFERKRKRWCQNVYQGEIANIIPYDITINISKFPHDRAVDIICKIAKLKRFQTTPESQKTMDELLIAAESGGFLISGHKTEHMSLLSY